MSTPAPEVPVVEGPDVVPPLVVGPVVGPDAAPLVPPDVPDVPVGPGDVSPVGPASCFDPPVVARTIAAPPPRTSRAARSATSSHRRGLGGFPSSRRWLTTVPGAPPPPPVAAPSVNIGAVDPDPNLPGTGVVDSEPGPPGTGGGAITVPVVRRAPEAASTNSEQVGNRAAGSLAIALARTASSDGGRPGRSTEAGGGGSMSWAAMTCASLSRGNGVFPVRHSCRTQASEYWSVRPSTGLPEHCSGDAYAGVPTKIPVRVRPSVDFTRFVSPKSVR